MPRERKEREREAPVELRAKGPEHVNPENNLPKVSTTPAREGMLLQERVTLKVSVLPLGLCGLAISKGKRAA